MRSNALGFAGFLVRARGKHGNSYSYREETFTVLNAKVSIVCPHHGEFSLWAMHHLKGSGCPRCRFDGERFIAQAREVHGDKFSYSTPMELVKGLISITCPEHGQFKQRPSSHLAGNGCRSCGREKRAYQWSAVAAMLSTPGMSMLTATQEDFRRREKGRMLVTCREHGEKRKRLDSILAGRGCGECYIAAKKTPLEEVKQAVAEAWGETYSYDWAAFEGKRSHFYVLCPKHGEFKARRDHHLAGFAGCRKCRRSSYGEVVIESWLEARGVPFKREWTSPEVLSAKGARLRFDFYLEQVPLFIEYDGPQHFSPYIWGRSTPEKEEGALRELQLLQERDAIKDSWAKSKGIVLIRLRRENLFEELATTVTALLEESRQENSS